METRSGRFILTLPSDANPDEHPENSPAHYITEFKDNFELPGGANAWEAALIEVSYPYRWYNVQNSASFLFLLLNPEEFAKLNRERIPIPVIREDMSLSSVSLKEALVALCNTLQNNEYNHEIFGQGLLAETADHHYNLPKTEIKDAFKEYFQVSPAGAIKTFPGFVIRIPAGYYKGVAGLVEHIQNQIKEKLGELIEHAKARAGNVDTSLRDKPWLAKGKPWIPQLNNFRPEVKVHFDRNTNYIQFLISAPFTGVIIASSPYLFRLIGHNYEEMSWIQNSLPDGFTPPKIYIAAAGKSDRALTQLDAHESIYVYSNLCQQQRIGGTLRQLLGVCPVKGEIGEQCIFQFTTPYFLPLAVDNLRQIEVQLGSDEGGTLVPFLSGKVICRILFQRRERI